MPLGDGVLSLYGFDFWLWVKFLVFPVKKRFPLQLENEFEPFE